MNAQMTIELNNGVELPIAGIGTFPLTPDEAEASRLSALECGYRLKGVRYYTSTPEMLKKYAEMVPPVDARK